MARDHLGDPVALERRVAGQELVERRAERVEVAPRVGAATERLLGRHVEGGPDGALFAAAVPATKASCEAEIAELGEPVLGQPDVLRLDVPMGEAVGVSVLEGLKDLIGEADHLFELETLSAGAEESTAQGAAGHELAHHVRDASLFAAVEDGDDSRVLREPRDGARLGRDSLARGCIETLGADERDRDVAIEATIAREIDAFPRPFADQPPDAVAAAGDRGRCPGGRDRVRRRGFDQGGERTLDVRTHLACDVEVWVHPARDALRHNHGDVGDGERRFEANAMAPQQPVDLRQVAGERDLGDRAIVDLRRDLVEALFEGLGVANPARVRQLEEPACGLPPLAREHVVAKQRIPPAILAAEDPDQPEVEQRRAIPG